MKKILTPEESKYLRRVCRYLASIGMTNGNIEIDADYGWFDCNSIDWNNITYFSNNYHAEIPVDARLIFKKILDYVCENDLIQGANVDGLNWERIELEIDCQNGEISVSHDYGYTTEGDSSGTSWILGEDNNQDEELKQIFDSLESSISSEPKNGILRLSYNGGGDSGYIESDFENGESVPADIEDWCYRALENLHGGWEINEGSQGTFIFNLEKYSIDLYHTYNIDESARDTVFEEKF